MATLAKNNAFGPQSPSWNLAFPTGNLTAVEILAYLPHWLKSIDVIDRLVANGGKAKAIAAIINEFRDQPKGSEFQANSVQIMMSYAMRRAGFENWTAGRHAEWARPVSRKEGDLSVRDFRPPRLTHPKHMLYGEERSYGVVHNLQASPISFQDLASHVKKHPSGPDTLDLARAVQHCLEHPNEIWLFPTDFERLTQLLGGPAVVTHSHHDKQAFARRKEGSLYPPKSTVKSSVTHRKANSQSITNRRTMPTPRITGAISEALEGPGPSMPISTSRKRKGNEGVASAKAAPDTKRRSRRLVGKAINFCEDSDPDGTDRDFQESPHVAVHATPARIRKPSHRIPPTLASPSNDSDFALDISEPDEDISEEEIASDEGVASPAPKTPRRAAAHKARQTIQSSFLGANSGVSAPAKSSLILKRSKLQAAYMSTVVSPKIMELVRAYPHRRPVLLAPPILSANRLKVDEFSIYLYAAEGCTTREEMWHTALSCYRFRGPRQHSPFRELHRLTEPDPKDTSDWAENIRWAREQYTAFGSDTWTEYDFHLETITEHRRETLWVSEATVAARM